MSDTTETTLHALFSIVAVPVYIPTNSVREFLFSFTPCPAVLFVDILILEILIIEVIPHCDFHVQSLKNYSC